MNIRRLMPFLLLAAVFFALINTGVFGLQTMAAYLYFTIGAFIAGIFIFTFFLFSKKATIAVPFYVAAFMLFCVYVNIHGVLTGTWGNTHIYWLSTSALFLSASLLYKIEGTNDPRLLQELLNGVFVIAVLESMVTVFQAAGILATKDKLFLATGTWINPNVTAMFLSSCVFFVLHATLLKKSRVITVIAFLLIIGAILLLRCRTAYLVTVLALLMFYQQDIVDVMNKRLPGKKKYYFLAVVSVVVLLLAALLINVKSGSSQGRLLVYKNSIGLIKERPVIGYGFGHFEQAYNLQVAERGLPSNGSVVLAYNDFIELMVEGGCLAVMLWAVTLIGMGVYAWINNYSLFPVLALAIIQMVNFAFQALPVFALLLLFIAFPVSSLKKVKSSATKKVIQKENSFLKSPYRMAIGVPLIIVSLLLVGHQCQIAEAYRELNKIPVKKYAKSVDRFLELENTLEGQPFFHEKFGDVFFRKGDLSNCLIQYKKALSYCSYPGVLVKYGYSLQEQKKYDSSLYYFNLARNIEPFKFATRLFILRMYEQKKDSVNVKIVARDIIDMPAKIPGVRVDEIRKYAQKTIMKY